MLACLAVTGRPHRRERLCALLWDLADDPRASLRWSLSKLRAAIDDAGRARIVADRETVAFDGSGAQVDAVALRRRLADIDAAATEELERVAALLRGPFLEGLDLPDCNEVHAWCVAEREEARRNVSRI